MVGPGQVPSLLIDKDGTGFFGKRVRRETKQERERSVPSASNEKLVQDDKETVQG